MLAAYSSEGAKNALPVGVEFRILHQKISMMDAVADHRVPCLAVQL